MKQQLRFVLCVIALLPTTLAARDFGATVKVLAFDTYGGIIPTKALKIEAFEDYGFPLPGPKKDYASKFHDGVAKEIPFGHYRIKASYPGFYSLERYVRIDQEKRLSFWGSMSDVSGIAFPIPCVSTNSTAVWSGSRCRKAERFL